ncbi:MAG: hypothetical protein R6X25_06400 [Candidatus Krumholzibacteriia bacterium]
MDQPTTDRTAARDSTSRTNLLFIHHSCGGQLLADPGEQVGGERGTGERCIHASHPGGGGLRSLLEQAGFAVNQASYGSVVAEDTDICHWHAKFRDQMDRILRTERQDALLPAGQTNEIVAFKSCYPNNGFAGRGREPGDPDSCEPTVANARAAYRAILPYLAERPDVLFVAFTAPPLTRPKPAGVVGTVKGWFGGEPRSAELAREFNTWLVDPEQGWLAGYEGANVAVFDYYDVLTGHGESDWSVYPSREGVDSHPTSEGNRRAAEAFLPFLLHAWQEFRSLPDDAPEAS